MIFRSTKDRGNQWLLVVEITVIVAIFFLDWRHLLPFSKTPFLFILGWISLRVRGQRWKDVGFNIPLNWPTLLLVGVLTGISMEALELFATQPALTKLLGRGPDLSQLNVLIGDAKVLVIAFVLAWVLAALGEELAYRGYLMNRIAGITDGGWTIS